MSICVVNRLLNWDQIFNVTPNEIDGAIIVFWHLFLSIKSTLTSEILRDIIVHFIDIKRNYNFF